MQLLGPGGSSGSSRLHVPCCNPEMHSALFEVQPILPQISNGHGFLTRECNTRDDNGSFEVCASSCSSRPCRGPCPRVSHIFTASLFAAAEG